MNIEPILLKPAPDYLAPDDSEIYLLANGSHGGLCQCVLPAGKTSHACDAALLVGLNPQRMDTMTVIEADSSHVDYLSDFGSRSFIYAYQCTLPVEELRKYTNVAFAESAIRKEIQASLATYFICQDSELNPCGYAKLIKSPPPQCVNSDSCIELQRLYVDSNFRGYGVGRRLELHAESYARKRNICDIWLRVWEGNVVAQEIYRHWDFEIVGEELYQVGRDRRTVLLMRRSLRRDGRTKSRSNKAIDSDKK